MARKKRNINWKKVGTKGVADAARLNGENKLHPDVKPESPKPPVPQAPAGDGKPIRLLSRKKTMALMIVAAAVVILTYINSYFRSAGGSLAVASIYIAIPIYILIIALIVALLVVLPGILMFSGRRKVKRKKYEKFIFIPVEIALAVLTVWICSFIVRLTIQPAIKDIPYMHDPYEIDLESAGVTYASSTGASVIYQIEGTTADGKKYTFDVSRVNYHKGLNAKDAHNGGSFPAKVYFLPNSGTVLDIDFGDEE